MADVRLTVDQDRDHILEDVRCFALDMDGTVYLGERWIDGALSFLHKIEETGRKYIFVTNNSSKNAAVYVEKLHRMGLDVAEDRIVTSGQAAIAYLKRHYPGAGVFLLGNPLLQEEFAQAGITLEEEKPDVVVTAFDTSLTYEKMCRVCDHVRAGLPYLATHPDYHGRRLYPRHWRDPRFHPRLRVPLAGSDHRQAERRHHRLPVHPHRYGTGADRHGGGPPVYGYRGGAEQRFKEHPRPQRRSVAGRCGGIRRKAASDLYVGEGAGGIPIDTDFCFIDSAALSALHKKAPLILLKTAKIKKPYCKNGNRVLYCI